MRRGTVMLAVFSLATTGLVVSSEPASAAFVGQKLGTSSFEIDTDANLVVDTSGNIDWLNGATLRSAFADEPSGSGDDSFGNGTKEDTEVPSVIDGSIPPNKSDLKYFGVYQETTAAFAQYLHLYWSRVQEPSGTTNMDFELNRSTTLSSNGVTPVRSENDLLITYDLTKGGTVPALSKRTWDNTNKVWRDAVALAGNAIGSINSSVITAANAGGATGIGALDPRTFGEATLDLNAIFGSGCSSFGSAYLKSRSSAEFNSAVKDFIAPRPVNVSNCGSVPIHKTDDTGAALGGATFTLYTNATPFGSPRGNEDTVTNPALSCQTNASGDCTISNVPFGSYWVVETVTPANHDSAAEQAVSVAPGGNSPTGTLTFVNNRQRGSIIVRKVEGSTPLANAGFTVSKTGFTSATMTEYATGLFCLDNLLYGTYTVTETTVPAGYTGAASAQNFAVSTRSTCAGRLGNPVSTSVTADLTFTNSKTPGTVNIAKTDDLSNPLQGATFKLFVDEPTSPGFSTRGTYDELYDTTLAAGPTQTSASGAIQWTSVPVGFYCAVETGTPVGYDVAAAQCFEVGLGTAAGGSTVNRTFVDNRQHRIVVLVCHEGTDTLLSSSVALTGGSTKTSLAAGSLTAAQQKALCDTGGASFGNLSGHDARTLTVTPSSH